MNKEFLIDSGRLTDYHGSGGEVIIPDGVKEISDRAFLNCTGVTAVHIPESVRKIGVYAFSGCTGLTDVSLPDSVQELGEHAFYNCTALTSVRLPDKLTTIESCLFAECSALRSIAIPERVLYIHSCAFLGCISLKEFCFDHILTIGMRAFQYCSSLTEVQLPDCLMLVGYHAFRYCTGLRSVRIRSITLDSETLSQLGPWADLDDILYWSSAYGNAEIPDDRLQDFRRTVWMLSMLSPEDERTIAYIRENLEEMCTFLMQEKETPTLKKLLSRRTFTSREDIERFIDIAVSQKAHDVQLMLMDYKEKTLGYDTPSERLKL